MKGPALCFRRRVRVLAVGCKSTLQKTYYSLYTIYLHRHIKRLFLPDLLWFGSVWCCSSLTPDLRPVLHCAIRHPRCHTGSPPWNDNTEEYKIYQTTSAHAEGPYSVKLNNQLSGMSLSQQRHATLNNNIEFGRQMLLLTLLDHQVYF